MATSFGERLKHFAMSVDYIDDDLCKSIRDLVDQYITKKLPMRFYHAMVDGTRIEGRPALKTASTSSSAWANESHDSIPIRDESGNYRGQSTFAYEKDLPLWITASEDGTKPQPLNEAHNFKDHWSGVGDLPDYFAEHKADIFTAIIVPLKYGDRVFGFVCLESDTLLECTRHAKHEIQALADTIAIVLWLHEGFLKQHNNSKHAFSEIQSMLGQRLPSPLSRPKLFIGSSSKADKDVMGAIRDVINELGTCVEETYWREIKDPGDITKQVLDEISQCRLGICYLSEPNRQAGADHKYTDNLNVVFEAGMLQSLSTSSTEGPEAWIPIREPDSPPAPFDIAHERTLVVNRLNGAEATLNRDGFAFELKDRLTKLLGGVLGTTSEDSGVSA